MDDYSHHEGQQIGLPDCESAAGETFIAVPESQWLEMCSEAGRWRELQAQSKQRESELRSEIKALREAKAKIAQLHDKLASAEDDDVVLSQGKVLKRLRKRLSGLQRRNAELEAKLKRSEAEKKWLQAEVERLNARIAQLNRLTFGDKSEKRSKIDKCADKSERKSDRKPGKKRPSKGKAKRRDYSHLPVKEEIIDVNPSECLCAKCGLPFVANGTENSELLEIEIQAYRRKLMRRRMRRACQCEGVSKQIVAAAPDRLFPHTRFGLSVWALYLHERFAMQRTVGGIERFTSAFGLALSNATLVNRNKDFVKLFIGVYREIIKRVIESQVVQGDETSWPIQHAGVVNGESYRGWLWMLGCSEAIAIHIDRFRSAEAAMALYGGFELSKGRFVILVCDRYSVYGKLAALLGLTLQYCIAHLRRDFINAAAGREELECWSAKWVDRFAKLYKLNDKRLEHYDSKLSLSGQNARFNECQLRLERYVDKFFCWVESELATVSSDSAKYQPLASAANNRSEFTVFVDHPQCPLDNNFSYADKCFMPTMPFNALI